MTSSATGSDSTIEVGKTHAVLDQGLGDEIFEIIWGEEPNPIPTIVDHAYKQIWKLLVLAGIQEKRRLSDVTLAEQLGVSRTPVRQALDRLVQDGLVRADPRRGFWVRVFTEQDVHELYDMRGALEVLALRLAAPSLDPADLTFHLDHLYDVRSQLDQRPVVPFLRSDLRLHSLLIHSSGNGRLIHCLATLRSQLSLFQVRDTSFPQRMEAALRDHEQILHALLQRDTDTAANLLADHLVHAKKSVLVDLFGAKGDE
ncbi:MAG TPA: GntR family transcriptional regulator [Ktedonobacteraceae bacterium]|nr:GntR family transcriptional regulator [Ktedonobacteraceae bacterium]